MYYEIDSNGKKLRSLPGYFDGFKKDLEKVDESILSDTQADYMRIDPVRIIELTEEEHAAYIAEQEQNTRMMQEALDYLSRTDYLHFKVIEEGYVIPAEILSKRAECRKTINDLQNA